MNNAHLSDLFLNFPFQFEGSFNQNPSISGIEIDSRKIKPGNLFIALKGGNYDGHHYIHSAIENGAAAIIGENPAIELSVPYIQVENTRRSISYLASAFFGFPGNQLTVIGVTGTDGKTTTSNLIFHILKHAGFKVGLISTVNAIIGNEILDTGFHVTTPDAHDVQRYLATMVSAGLTHVVLETTSHGLSQHRVDASQYDIAVVTNVTHEHLDEHGSYENYLAAKGRMFELLSETPAKKQGNLRLAVLNKDDTKSYAYLSEISKDNQVSYGLSSEADIYAKNIEYSTKGLKFEINGSNYRVNASSSLVGAYNVSNCLAAFSVAVVGLGISPELAAEGLEKLPSIPGRMEVIDMGQNFTAIVDFAHTPNALRVALQAARQMTTGRVISIFGSAGLRDREKRRMMAETSSELADISILTAEDPRTESLDEILKQMAIGAESRGGKDGETFFCIQDRGEAIRQAVQMAQPGDLVIACGKGHEQSMCFGTTEYLWDDRTAMRAALSQQLGVAGPEMPYLPTQG